MNTYVLRLNDNCTLSSDYPYLTIENEDEIAIVGTNNIQAVFARNEENAKEEYSYVPIFFYTTTYEYLDMIIVDGSTVRVIKTSEAEIRKNKIFVPSILIHTDTSPTWWEIQKPQPIEDFGLNLPCYVAYTRDNRVAISLQNDLIIKPLDKTGVHVVYGREGFVLFQLEEVEYGMKTKCKTKAQFFYNNSSKPSSACEFPLMFGYSGKDTKIIGCKDESGLANISVNQLPGIQAPPFFFSIGAEFDMFGGPLTTPFCGYFGKGRLFILTPDGESSTIQVYNSANKKDLAIHPVNIVQGSKVVAIYVLVSYKNTDGFRNMDIYRVNLEDYALERVYSLKGFIWLIGHRHMVGEITQDIYYIYYMKEGWSRVKNGILALTENEICEIDTREIENESMEYQALWHFWPNPNVAAINFLRKVALIRGTDSVKVINTKSTSELKRPFFCAGNKLYAANTNGEIKVHFIGTNKPPEDIYATLLWGGDVEG